MGETVVLKSQHVQHGVDQLCSDRPRRFHGVVFKALDGVNLDPGVRTEHFIGLEQGGGHERLLRHRDVQNSGHFQNGFAADAVEDPAQGGYFDDTVLDQIAGSGPTLVKCKLLQRNAIVVDINPDAVIVTRNRLDFPYTPLMKNIRNLTQKHTWEMPATLIKFLIASLTS